jgi:hypothetical protein
VNTIIKRDVECFKHGDVNAELNLLSKCRKDANEYAP